MDAFFSLMYPPSPPTRQSRTKPLRVLALGLSRTGTESLKQALTILGYDHVYHGFDFLIQSHQVHGWIPLLERKINNHGAINTEDLDNVIGHCEAVTDLPCSALARELIDAYPDALVISNHRRDLDAWYRSYAQTVDPLVTNWWYMFLCHFDSETYWARRLVRNVQTIHYWGDFVQMGKLGYMRHYEMVREAAKGRCLEWTVEDGWEPLCAFLGKHVPDVEFPRGNDPAAFEAEKNRVTVERFQRAAQSLRRVGIVFAGVAGSILASVFFLHG